MDFSRTAPAPRRFAGIGLVVALHVAGIYALSAGLIKVPGPHREPAKLLPPIPETPRELPKEPTIRPDKPTFAGLPTPTPLDPLPWSEATPTVTATLNTPSDSTGARPEAQGSGPTTAAHPPSTDSASSGLKAPGAVCAVMPRPEVPAVAWSGEAVLQAVATVRGGRVVGSEIRVIQGSPDSKTRRALQRAVDGALAGYQCQGDAMFQQDFAFRLD